MALSGTIHYIAIILISLTSTILTYHIYRRIKLPALGDYFILIFLSCVWGFFIWLVPGLVADLLDHNPHIAGLSFKIISVLKWFAFPLNIFHAYFLALFLSRLLGQRIIKRLKIPYFTGSLLLSLYLLIRLTLELSTGITKQFHGLSVFVSYLFIFLELGILIYYLFRARKSESIHHQIVFSFTCLTFILYVLYLLIGSSYSPLKWLGIGSTYTLSLHSFYAVWYLPLILIYHYFSTASETVFKKRISEGKMLTFC